MVPVEEVLMKLICPACGAIASAEAWSNDGTCREALALIAGLPSPLPKAVLAYISLFRPGKTGLTWKKALRLSQEINALTACGYVSAPGKVDRPCPARIWAQAMEQMVEKRGALSLPLKNHNYLRQVAWQLADQEDAKAEQSKPRVSRNTDNGPAASIQNPLDEYIQGLRDSKPTDEEMALWKAGRMR
jgi:hypothetical protein